MKQIVKIKFVTKTCEIRSWYSDEWVEPTVDIYERDCKGQGC